MRFPTPIVVLALGVLTLALGPATASARGLNRAESRIVQLLNDIRADHGLPSFAVSRALSRASRRHSGEMIDGDYFDHDTLQTGESWDHRVRSYVDAARIGENLAWGSGTYATPEMIVKMWMDSAPHRRCILDGHFRRVGIGRAVGAFRGEDVAAVFTADFASSR